MITLIATAIGNPAGRTEESRNQAISPLTTQTEYSGKRLPLYVRLLIFIVVIGLPIVGIPSLRGRLKRHVRTLYAAITAQGPGYQMLAVRIDEKTGPFPPEHAKSAARAPEPPKIVQSPARPPQAVRAVQSAELRKPPSTTANVQQAAPEDSRQAGEGPSFGQGREEQQAYELLLQSSQPMASLATGSDPTLRFKSWAAARAEGDAWLVRVAFTYLPDGSEREYIWRVKLQSKEVFPLSAYARTLFKP